MFSSLMMFGQTRDLGGFHGISVSTGVDVTLVKASSPRVEITMKKGDAKDLITKIKNGVLYVKTKSSSLSWGNKTEAEVTVYYTKLDEIKVSSGSILRSDNVIDADDMDIEVTSGSSAQLEVDAKNVEVYVSSGATLKLKGGASKGKFEASSGSTLNAYNFETENAFAEASSGASLSIHVNDTLDAEAGSGGSISYTGNVKNKKIDAGWSGSIKRKN